MNNRHSSGVTLVEVLIVIAIIGIVVTFAVPSYERMIERNRLREAVESFKSDVMFARTEAIKRSQNVVVSRTAGDAGAWCYGVNIGIACDCAETVTTETDYCQLKRVSGAGFNTTNMPAAGAGNSTFNFRRGTIGANGVTFTTTNYGARVVFGNTGRVRVCTPSGADGLSGYPDC